MQESLEQWLLTGGRVTPAQLDLAKREQLRRQLSLENTLVAMGIIDPVALMTYRSKTTGSNIISLDDKVIAPTIFRRIPEENARNLRVFAFEQDGGTLHVAMEDPLNITVLDFLERITGCNILPYVASEYDLLKTIDRHYTRIYNLEELAERIIVVQRESLTTPDETDFPIIQLVDNILFQGIFSGASDIHIHPEEKLLRIRLRIDGVMQEGTLLPKQVQTPIITRLKLMSNLDITENRLPQDGRITFPLGNREVAFRTSTRPTAHGESVVLRILDTGDLQLSLSSLGFDEKLENSFRSLIEKPHGIILVTGPTGSGKTTTLYASLQCIDANKNSIFTLEDPIEFRLPLVRQTQVHEEIGLTFAEGLRNALRQDPDVILVGEIRDTETAEMTIRASLTGHLVLSTLHTNDALGSIERLVDLGIAPTLIADTLLAALAQRLVRILCPKCKRLDPEGAAKLTTHGFSQKGDGTFYTGEGCPYCYNTGYKKRLGIYELAIPDEVIKKGIVERTPHATLLAALRQQGFKTLFEDGIEKASHGLTSVDEVLRVATQS